MSAQSSDDGGAGNDWCRAPLLGIGTCLWLTKSHCCFRFPPPPMGHSLLLISALCLSQLSSWTTPTRASASSSATPRCERRRRRMQAARAASLLERAALALRLRRRRHHPWARRRRRRRRRPRVLPPARTRAGARMPGLFSSATPSSTSSGIRLRFAETCMAPIRRACSSGPSVISTAPRSLRGSSGPRPSSADGYALSTTIIRDR